MADVRRRRDAPMTATVRGLRIGSRAAGIAGKSHADQPATPILPWVKRVPRPGGSAG